MKGTVLHFSEGEGIILGEDGLRYRFGEEDVKNALLKNGSKVDFIPEESSAKEIYTLESEPQANPANLQNEPSELKTGAFIAAFGAFLSLFSTASSLLGITGFALELYGVYRLALYKGEMSFFWYKVKAFVAGIAAIGLLTSAWIGSFGFFFAGFTGMGIGTLMMLLLAAAAGIYSVIAMFSALNGIAQTYDAPMFTVAAWLYLISLATMILGIGFLLMGVYSILLIIAYLSIKEQ